jgi:hypothetical protein
MFFEIFLTLKLLHQQQNSDQYLSMRLHTFYLLLFFFNFDIGLYKRFFFQIAQYINFM